MLSELELVACVSQLAVAAGKDTLSTMSYY